MSETQEEFRAALGRLVEASAELDGEVAHLYAAAGSVFIDMGSGPIPATSIDEWKAALKGSPSSFVRKRAQLLVDKQLRKEVLDVADRVVKAQQRRDQHVHSIASAGGVRWWPREDTYFRRPTAAELELLALQLEGLRGEASMLAARIPADSLRTRETES